MYTILRKWQHENPMFLIDGTSWILLLLPIILRSEVHLVEWKSSRIRQWTSSPVPLPPVMWIEASCTFREVHWCSEKVASAPLSPNLCSDQGCFVHNAVTTYVVPKPSGSLGNSTMALMWPILKFPRVRIMTVEFNQSGGFVITSGFGGQRTPWG